MPRLKPKKIGVQGGKRRGRYDTCHYFPEDFARKVVRQHHDENLPFVLPLCGPRVVAEELIRRYRVKCQPSGSIARWITAVPLKNKAITRCREPETEWELICAAS